MTKAEANFILDRQAKAWRKKPEILFPFNSLNI